MRITDKHVFSFFMILVTLLSTGCRSTKNTPGVGRVYVFSEPADGADIFINGRKQKIKSNAYFNLKPGTYNIELVKKSDQPDQPEIGKARVKIEPGVERRVTINLSRMRIVPAETSNAQLRPTSPAQKTILDYYGALSAKDIKKAFAYLSYNGQRNQGGYLNWQREWKNIASVKVLDLKFESADATSGVEVNNIELETTSATSTREPIPLVKRSQFKITTIDELKNVGLVKIEEIIQASPAI